MDRILVHIFSLQDHNPRMVTNCILQVEVLLLLGDDSAMFHEAKVVHYQLQCLIRHQSHVTLT